MKLSETFKIAAVFIVLFVSNVSAFELKVLGLEKPEQSNVSSYLAYLKANPLEQVSNRAVQSAVDKALNPFGYYHSKVELERVNNANLIVHVESGPRTTIKSIEIDFECSLEDELDFDELEKASRLKIGEPLSHQDYDGLKRNIERLAIQKGYLLGSFTKSELKVLPSSNFAFVKLQFNCGEKYYFGRTSVRGSQIDEFKLTNLQPFNEEEPFQLTKLSEYQTKLSETGWFRSAVVTAEYDEADDNHQVPISVEVIPNAKNQVEVGGGYSVDVGVRASLRWRQPWYNEKGHSFESRLDLSKPKQTLGLGYRIPTENVLMESYDIQFKAEHIDYLDTKSFLGDLRFAKSWQLDEHWLTSLYLKYHGESYTQAGVEGTSRLLMPGISFAYLTHKQNRSELRHKHEYAVEFSERQFFSDTPVLRITGSSLVSFDITSSQKLNFRYDFGANITDAPEELPSSLRFFSGGGESIRGYQYNSVSPVDSNGELTGAQYMMSAGLEYQYNVHKSWWLGGFVDIGDAFDSKPEPKFGTGMSIIWESQYVPIKLDIARSVNDQSTDDWRLHLSVGTQF